MAVYKTTKLEKALCRKGFVKNETHHKILRFYYQGKKTPVKTRLSHGIKEYNDSLLGQLKKQLKLPDKQRLIDLIECPLDHKEYAEILKSNNEI